MSDDHAIILKTANLQKIFRIKYEELQEIYNQADDERMRTKHLHISMC